MRKNAFETSEERPQAGDGVTESGCGRVDNGPAVVVVDPVAKMVCLAVASSVSEASSQRKRAVSPNQLSQLEVEFMSMFNGLAIEVFNRAKT